MITDDFNPTEFMAFLDSDVQQAQKLSGIIAMTITLAESFAKRADISKYAVCEGVCAYMIMAIAAEVKKELALDALKSMTELVKAYDPGTKH
jgi:hypothetical protein